MNAVQIELKTGEVYEHDDFGAVVICAERYALGRQTYMPSIVQRFIRDNIAYIDDNDIGVLISDIEDAGKLGYGDEMIDKPGWMRTLQVLKDERERRVDYEKKREDNVEKTIRLEPLLSMEEIKEIMP